MKALAHSNPSLYKLQIFPFLQKYGPLYVKPAEMVGRWMVVVQVEDREGDDATGDPARRGGVSKFLPTTSSIALPSSNQQHSLQL